MMTWGVWCHGAFTERFLRQLEHLSYQREVTRVDDVWHDVSSLYGLLRPPRESLINIYRAATKLSWTFPLLIQLYGGPSTFPVSLIHEITAAYNDMYAFRLVPVDTSR